VVALVNDVYGEVVGQLASDGLPVVEGAEEAVQDDDREALSESLVIEIEHDISNTFAGCSFMLKGGLSRSGIILLILRASLC